ncbi:hypothetical protein JCM10207_007140 [Rhodosporidiobolus poonsookiae]
MGHSNTPSTPPTSSSSSSPPPPRPSLPTARVPVDTIPHLIPWPTLATYLLPLVSLAFPGLFAALDVPLRIEAGQLAQPVWVDRWWATVPLSAWDTLGDDDEADRRAFVLFSEYIKREEEKGASGWELARVRGEQHVLRARILDRWLRVLALRIAHRQAIALERADDPRLRPFEPDPVLDADADARLDAIRDFSVYPSSTFRPPPYEPHARILSATATEEDLAPFRLPAATNPHSTVDADKLWEALFPHQPVLPFPPSLVALYPAEEHADSTGATPPTQPRGSSDPASHGSLRPRTRTRAYRVEDEPEQPTGADDASASGLRAGRFLSYMLPRAGHARTLARQASAAFRPPERKCALCTLARLQKSRDTHRRANKPSTSAIPYSPPSRSFSSTPFPPSARKRAPRAPAPDALEALEAALALPSAADRAAALPSLISSLDSALAAPPSPLSPPSRTAFDALWAQVAALTPHEPAFSSAILKRLRLVSLTHLQQSLSLAQARELLRARVDKDLHDRRARVRRFGEEAVKPRRREGRAARVDDAKMRELETAGEEVVALLDAEAEAGRGQPSEYAEQDAALLEALALALANRLPPFPSPSCAPEAADLALARRASSALLRALALRPPPSSSETDRPEPSTAASLPLPFLFASPAREDRLAALHHLQRTAESGLLPTVSAIRAVVRYAHAPLPPPSSFPSSSSTDVADADADAASYLHARAVLDAACAPSSSFARSSDPDALDALLQARLARVEREEALRDQPTLWFVRWLGFAALRPPLPRAGGNEAGEVELERQSLDAALHLWEASQVRGRSEWGVGARASPRSPVAKLLEALVREACRLEALSPSSSSPAHSPPSAPPPASACLRTAVRLVLEYAPHPLVVHNAPTLLRAVTVTSSAPALALALFDALTGPPSPTTSTSASPARPYAPFTWSAALLPSFSHLFHSAAAAADPTLPLRLYLSWTASGLQFPQGLWNGLWRAAGRRGDVHELARLVQDWEETGRGRVAGRIVHLVVAAACETGPGSGPGAAGASPPSYDAPSSSSSPYTASNAPARIVAPLRLLSFFRTRYASPSSPPPPRLALSAPWLLIPRATYVSVLRALARSFTDRRRAFREVWRQLVLDGYIPPVEAHNAAIASHVWRPGRFFTVKDLDRAGEAYDALVGSGQKPDRETFSLLVHGFLRIAAAGPAREGGKGEPTAKRRRVTLEAALRTFHAAHGSAAGFVTGAGGPGVRGHQTAKLVRTLAAAGRFEDAKEAQEAWWRGFVGFEARAGGREGEGKEEREVKAETRAMRAVRDEVERVEREWAAQARAGEREEGEWVDDVEVRLVEGGEDGLSPEVFETAPLDLACARERAEPPLLSHPSDTALHN